MVRNYGPKYSIIVLSGGISSEREVSLKGGKAVGQALRDEGHSVIEMDVAPDDLSFLNQKCDLIFPVLHGAFGEDGQLQQILERRGIPFVGSGEKVSRLAINKAATKSALLDHNIPTANWEVVYQHKFKASWSPASGIGFPCVIKPVAEGSSVGCKVCKNIDIAREYLAESLPKYALMLVESYIDGYELTVGILDGEPLPTIWIKPKTPFYDYEAKYAREDTEYLFNLPLPIETLDRVQSIALAAHTVIGCRHLSRVDIMVDKQTLQADVLEINTMPGFTSHSLIPKAAEHEGIPFNKLCGRLAGMAVRDYVP